MNGHLDVLKWLCENKCPCDVWTYTCAAVNGHLDIMKWAKQNAKYEWDDSTDVWIRENKNNIDLLKWEAQYATLGDKMHKNKVR